MARIGENGEWLAEDLIRDLEVQGGLAGVFVNPLYRVRNGHGGYTGSAAVFFVSWEGESFLRLEMSHVDLALVRAFSKVMGFEPFCRYVSIDNTFEVFEWNDNDQDRRIEELKRRGERKLRIIN